MIHVSLFLFLTFATYRMNSRMFSFRAQVTYKQPQYELCMIFCPIRSMESWYVSYRYTKRLAATDQPRKMTPKDAGGPPISESRTCPPPCIHSPAVITSYAPASAVSVTLGKSRVTCRRRCSARIAPWCVGEYCRSRDGERDGVGDQQPPICS
jgi:hypothetical protein